MNAHVNKQLFNLICMHGKFFSPVVYGKFIIGYGFSAATAHHEAVMFVIVCNAFFSHAIF